MSTSTRVVSVIIPAYNVSQYIAETLSSVVSQSFKDWEAIVVNDGSSDTSELEKAIGPFLSRITYISQANRGVAAARNVAIKAACGEWLAFLDGDDYWMPDFLEKQIAFLKQGKLDMSWADGVFIGDTTFDGRRISDISPCSGNVTIARLINGKINISNSSTLVRRSLVLAVGGVDESLRRAQDFDLWIRLALTGAKIGFLNEPLLHYRVRQGNLTGDVLSNSQRELNVLQCLLDKKILSPSQTKIVKNRIGKVKALLELIHGKRLLANRDYKQARASFGRAKQMSPSLKLGMVLFLFPFVAPLLRKFYLLRTPPEFR